MRMRTIFRSSPGGAGLAAVFLVIRLGSAEANTITAAGVDPQSVLAAVALASDGDTVVLPAGSATWTIPIAVDCGSITIQGAGIGRTVITDNVPKATGATSVLWTFNTTPGKSFRLTGLSVYGQAQDTNNNNKGTLVFFGGSHAVRVDHVEIHRPGTGGMLFNGDMWGVIDHCVFDESNFKQAIQVQHANWLGTSYGDGSWHDSLSLGTEKAIYIEDCTFLGSGSAGAGVVDSTAGGRFVFRNNVVTNDYLATHGTEGSIYQGVRSYEIYNNTFVNQNNIMFTAIYLRGGTGVIFNNTLGGSGGATGYKSAIVMANYRSDMANNHFSVPWGMCTGSNPWDGNTDSLGYPSIGQVGRGTEANAIRRDAQGSPTNATTGTPSWPHNASEPLYEWGDKWSPIPNNVGSFIGAQQAIIQQKRDYFVGTPKPGYTPYTYPHPLVTGASPSTTPAAPQNLRVTVP